MYQVYTCIDRKRVAVTGSESIAARLCYALHLKGRAALMVIPGGRRD